MQATASKLTSKRRANQQTSLFEHLKWDFNDKMASPIPVSSLRLLVPPLRLLTAAMWQVAQQRSVKHYGILGDFVSLVTDAIPELLTDKQKCLLLLALRVKLSDSATEECDCAPLSLPEKVSPVDRRRLSQDVFNQTFDRALQALLSDFLCRTEQLFPVPDFKQAVSWLTSATAGFADCLGVPDREELKTLLSNQRHQLGQVPSTVDCETEKILLSAWSHPLIAKLSNHEAAHLSTQAQSDVHVDIGSPAQLTMENQKEEIVSRRTASAAEAKSNSASCQDSCTAVNLKAQRLKDMPANSDEPSRHSSDPPHSHIMADALHNISHHSQRVAHKCPQCGKCFIYRSQVLRHLRTSKSCGHTLTRSAAAHQDNIPAAHEETRLEACRPTGKHPCFQCKDEFLSKAELLLHQRSHRARPIFPCGQCDKEFLHLSSLTNHKQTHQENGGISCSQCGKVFGSAKERDAHSLQHRLPDLTCNLCSQVFSSQSQLLRHLQTHTVEGAEPCFPCRFCDQTFSGVTLLRIHQRSHRTRSFQCDQCDKTYGSLTGLQSHRTSHMTDSRFLCPQCGKCFKTRDGLEGHLRTHSGERPYRCPYCPKDFTALAGLNVHVRRHTGERPYVCTVCGKGWPSGGDLQKHMRIHTGERPFSCQECGKSFSNSCHLSEHRRIHTGEKPFSCPECGKCLRRKFDLNKHMLCHSNKRPYACLSCPKSYTRKTHLNRHLLTHRTDGGEPEAAD
ncbi:zinc finger protein ZFMSA12A-like isoform X2 [Nerophis ophidion]|uniref:zinc finger protein ZFMSA12A-like isoform X2 n=1 Tax=Nerophis ophidion TaxID=159077 RepID=UPI002AE08C8A|nr:zinc finger protein ZFMSA12A-like isoform X2 [Nerophis ophidion]